jgi:cell division protease FtsH
MLAGMRHSATVVSRRVAPSAGSDGRPGPSPLSLLLAEHLGPEASQLPAASGAWPFYEHVNIQTGVDRWLEEQPGQHRLVGLTGFRLRMFGLSDLCQPEGEYGVGLGGAATVEVVAGPDGETRSCVMCGLYLVADGPLRIAVLLRGSDQRGPQHDVALEVIATDPAVARAVVSRIGQLAVEHSVYRGRVVSFQESPFAMRGGALVFHPRPRIERRDLVLPEGVLDGVEQQIHGVARHRRLLHAHGLHLKRGVLLYGAPGVGKTHTVRYLMSLLPESTVIVVSGDAMRFLTTACSLARALQPVLLVLEDIDLIAQERSQRGPVSLLFQLLNEMDGVGEDVDVAFVLTTNRVDVLEPALASRPGRIDHAAELPLPDAEGRRRLLEIYRGSLDLDLTDVDGVVRRTEGMTASFLKELLRKAALVAADAQYADAGSDADADANTDADANANTDGAEPPAVPLRVTDEHMHAALDLLLDARNLVTRRLLGAAADGDRPRSS